MTELTDAIYNIQTSLVDSLEQGSKYMNELAAEEFYKKYSFLVDAINEAVNLADKYVDNNND